MEPEINRAGDNSVTQTHLCNGYGKNIAAPMSADARGALNNSISTVWMAVVPAVNIIIDSD